MYSYRYSTSLQYYLRQSKLFSTLLNYSEISSQKICKALNITLHRLTMQRQYNVVTMSKNDNLTTTKPSNKSFAYFTTNAVTVHSPVQSNGTFCEGMEFNELISVLQKCNKLLCIYLSRKCGWCQSLNNLDNAREVCFGILIPWCQVHLTFLTLQALSHLCSYKR